MSADLELGTSKQAFEPPLACTVARDVYHFDLLIEDMENLWGDKWGDLSFADAVEYFGQPEAQSLKLITVAVSHRDEEDIAVVAEIIRRAKGRGIRVLLIAGDVSPAMLHQFLKLGADDFVPYPLPDGALKDAVTRVLTAPSPAAQSGQALQTARTLAGPSDRGGSVFAVHGLAGGGWGRPPLRSIWRGKWPPLMQPSRGRSRHGSVSLIWICNLAMWRPSWICPAAK